MRSFDELRAALSEVYSVDLPKVQRLWTRDFGPLKKFCGGLLEKGTTHEWRSAISRLSVRSRMGIAASLFLFRKVIPSPDPDIDQYCQNMSEPSPPGDPAFLRFAASELRGMFPRGWDRGYADRVLRSVPPVKSCMGSKREEGGVRGMTVRGEWVGFEGFRLFALATPSPSWLTPSRVCSVEAGGKKRIVSTPCADMNFLRPLHQTLYDRISRFPWLLRGDAKASALASFVSVSGEVFVSGDYEAATDNLNSNVQKSILRVILSRCTHVPPGIMSMAEDSLSMRVRPLMSSDIYRQNRGQLMGNLLSFPLLCIVNYLAFKYVVRRDVPVRVNGDDIVFRSTPEEQRRWAEQVGRSGLKLSVGKTMIDSRFFSLNSTWFHSTRSRVRLVPVLRSGAFGLGGTGELSSLRGRFRSYAAGFGRSSREKLDRRWLRKHAGKICATNRSLRRGLGINPSFSALCGANLWFRESFYLSMAEERPLPPEEGDVVWSVRIPGWRMTYGSMSNTDIERQKEHSALVTEACWSTTFSPKESAENYGDAVLDGTSGFSSWLSERKRMRGLMCSMLRLSPQNFRRFSRPKRSLYESYRPPVRKSWFYISTTERAPRNVVFVKGVK